MSKISRCPDTTPNTTPTVAAPVETKSILLGSSCTESVVSTIVLGINGSVVQDNILNIVSCIFKIQDNTLSGILRYLFGRPFVKRFALCYRSVVLSCPVCLSVCLSVCDVGVLWPNGWPDQGGTWHGGGPQPRRLCVG